MKRKTTKTRKRRTVSPPKVVKTEETRPSVPFHEAFPVMLEHKNDKENKKCYFVCKEHCDSYIKRNNLKKSSYKVSKTPPRDEKDS